MDGSIFPSLPPSAASDYLKSCLGLQIKEIVRFSWWPAADVYDEVGGIGSSAFAATAGPLAIHFVGGTVVGVASDPAQNSVVVWNEAGRTSTIFENSLERDGELFGISASDERYSSCFWRTIPGRKLVALNIFKRRMMNAKGSNLPSEVGLQFVFDDGESFLASHGLPDGSDDFSILEGSKLLELDLICHPL